MVSPQDGSTRDGPSPPQATPLRGNSTENRNNDTICTFRNGWWEFANKAPLATPLLFFSWMPKLCSTKCCNRCKYCSHFCFDLSKLSSLMVNSQIGQRFQLLLLLTALPWTVFADLASNIAVTFGSILTPIVILSQISTGFHYSQHTLLLTLFKKNINKNRNFHTQSNLYSYLTTLHSDLPVHIKFYTFIYYYGE